MFQAATPFRLLRGIELPEQKRIAKTSMLTKETEKSFLFLTTN
jgi:hypothetical protein